MIKLLDSAHYISLGIEVNYAGEIANIPLGPALICCLLLCWTADHPAQCEVGKFLSSGGVHACRRDKLHGVLTQNKLCMYSYICTCIYCSCIIF